MATFTIGTGGDYGTVDEWWSALPATLTENHIGVVLPSGTTWGGNVTTSATFGPHKAVLTSNYSGVIGGSDMPAVTVGVNGIRASATAAAVLEIRKLFLTGGARFSFVSTTGGPVSFYLYDCEVRATTGTLVMVDVRPVFGTRVIENCIFEQTNGGGSSGWHIDARNAGSAEIRVKNCLFIQSSALPDFSVIGFNADTRSLHSCGFFAPNAPWARSAIFTSSSRGDYNYGDHASVVSNMLGTNNVSGVVLSDSEGAGLRWLVNDLLARDLRSKNVAGNVALSGGDPANSTPGDMLGVARDSTPDAGPFEFLASARQRSRLILTPW